MGIGASATGRFGRLRNGAGELASQVAQSEVVKKGSVELQNFFSDVQDLLAKVTDLDDREVAAIRSRVQDSLDVARESVQDGARRVRDTASDWRDSAEEHARSAQREIRKRPLTIGLAAAVIGVVLGALLARGRAE
jgi:ElaB/YqjD/DUF883 family membrane-anchored ribosome-binding protein